MNFITGLPWLEGFNAINVIIDRLIKERYYVPCVSGEDGTTSEATVLILLKEVFRLYGLPFSIISDRGP